jgi:hypothetical protein
MTGSGTHRASHAQLTRRFSVHHIFRFFFFLRFFYSNDTRQRVPSFNRLADTQYFLIHNSTLYTTARFYVATQSVSDCSDRARLHVYVSPVITLIVPVSMDMFLL